MRAISFKSHYLDLGCKHDLLVYVFVDLAALATAERVCTDGSSGKCSADPRTRRCGRAAVALNNNNEPAAAICCGLEGLVQTVPRAEVHSSHWHVGGGAEFNC